MFRREGLSHDPLKVIFNHKAFFLLNKYAFIILPSFFAALCLGSGCTQDYYDNDKFDRSEAVLRVQLVEPGYGSKYYWPKIKVLDIYKNDPNRQFNKGGEYAIAHLSFMPALPKGVSTIYLEKYNPDKPEYGWKLLEGSGEAGSSHMKPGGS